MIFTRTLSFLASIKKTLIISAVVFAVGVGAGIWITNKFYAAGKINMLNNYIDRQAENHKATLVNLQKVHQVKLKIAQDSVRIEKVAEYVKDNRECDLSSDAVGLLDNSRTGMPYATTRTDEGSPGPATITQRQQIKSCAFDGIQYRNLNADHRALIQWYNDNWKKK